MKLSFVGPALLISVLCTLAQHGYACHQHGHGGQKDHKSHGSRPRRPPPNNNNNPYANPQPNAPYQQANGAYPQANPQANGPYQQANAPYQQSNGAYPQANGAYLQANPQANGTPQLPSPPQSPVAAIAQPPPSSSAQPTRTVSMEV